MDFSNGDSVSRRIAVLKQRAQAMRDHDFYFYNQTVQEGRGGSKVSVNGREMGLAAAAQASGRRLVVVEDHYPEGGVGGAVLAALAGTGEHFRVEHLAVRGMPGSATPDHLMKAAGISAEDVEAAALRLLDR